MSHGSILPPSCAHLVWKIIFFTFLLSAESYETSEGASAVALLQRQSSAHLTLLRFYRSQNKTGEVENVSKAVKLLFARKTLLVARSQLRQGRPPPRGRAIATIFNICLKSFERFFSPSMISREAIKNCIFMSFRLNIVAPRKRREKFIEVDVERFICKPNIPGGEQHQLWC